MTATFNHFEKTGVRMLADIRPELVSRFRKLLRDAGISESTIRTYLKHLKAALSWAQELEFIAEVPEIKLPRRGRLKSKRMKGRPVTGEGFDRMIAAVASVCSHDVDAWRSYTTGPASG
jgi:integrase